MRLALKVRADDGLEEYMYECSICGTTEIPGTKRN
jgi:hypothetical protein